MCTWFCETFCCFLIRFQHHLRYRKEDDSTGDHLESGEPTFHNPVFHHRYQGNTPSPPTPIPLAPTYPGGPPHTAKRKKRSPPPTVPRAVPLPVRYPPGQTPTGKNFRHHRPVPNRMKPLPPLIPSFDKRSQSLKAGGQTTEGSATEKPTLSDSHGSFLTPAPVNVSPMSSPRHSVSLVSVQSVGGISAVAEETDATQDVKQQQDRQDAVLDYHHRRQEHQQRHPHGIWANIGGSTHGWTMAEREHVEDSSE